MPGQDPYKNGLTTAVIIKALCSAAKVASFKRKSASPSERLAALEPRSLRGSSTSDYSCAASQNTKINKQSQRF